MKIGITGAGGYIGSRITKLALETGYDVVPIDNGHTSQVDSVEGYEIIDQDVREIDGLRKELGDVDVIFHLAAIPGIPDCEENGDLAFDVNVRGTENIARICRSNQIPLVFPMSMQVFGEVEEFPITEGNRRQPVNNYGITKSIGEKTIEILSDESFSAVVFVKSNVYGSHEVGDQNVGKGTVVNYFVGCTREREDLTVHSPGTQSKDFIHVKDVAEAYLDVLENLKEMENGKEVYLLASEESTSIEELAEMISEKSDEILDYKPGVKIVENPRENDMIVENFDVDASKIREGIGFETRYSLEKSVEEMLADE